uniref:Transcription factor Adf-1 n=2 Tax=Lygus hesperus TaxID=30085 RepID=A0A0A9Y611_LYGHE
MKYLYNYNCPGHTRKDLMDKAWQEVAAKVNLPAAECKERWRNLRTVFIRKIKQSQDGHGRRRRTSYYLTDAMQFCLPFIMPRTSSKSLPSIHNNIDTTSEISNQKEINDDPISPAESSDDLGPQHSFQQMELSQTEYNNPSYSTLPIASQKVEVESEEDEDQCVVEGFEVKRARLESTAIKGAAVSQNIEKMEALKMFLLSLLPELGDLDDSQIKLFKRRVFNIIDEITNMS